MRDKLPGTPEGIRYVTFYFAKPGEPGMETKDRGMMRAYGQVTLHSGAALSISDKPYTLPVYQIAFNDPTELPLRVQEAIAVRILATPPLSTARFGKSNCYSVAVRYEHLPDDAWQEFIDTMGGAYEWPT